MIDSALAWGAAPGCVAWLFQAGLLALHLSRLRTVSRTAPPEPTTWPTVSAIVPARDEERSIASALRSRLSDDYPALQVVVVDDRSQDTTPALIAEIAALDDRIVPVRIEELPTGWLGKTHALARGVEAATGEWLLVSDADVHMA
ncbi:glycosyltransferase, partial [bacterium]|nr:glycosyltransferase [bacterium]